MPKLVYNAAEIPLAGICVLGRHRGCTVQVKDDAASRQHAEVSYADGKWWIQDLGSANGTSLNGTLLPTRTKQKLKHGDRIAIGTQEIRFHDQGSALYELPAVANAKGRERDFAKLVGQEFAGYRIERIFGHGTLGIVYGATQINLQRPVAFKVFDPALGSRDPALIKRFTEEAGRVGSLRHDGLVHLHESGETDGLLWCSMELVQGETLAALLKRDGSVPPALALLIAEKAAEALQVAHAAGVVHGDLRPATIFLTPEGGIKLTDIGMMHIFEGAELDPAAPGETAAYLSPEQAKSGADDPRSDLYSLGCVLFHLLTGRPPFVAATVGEAVKHHTNTPVPSLKGLTRLPPKIEVAKADAVIQGLLAKNPEWRYATCAEALAELRPLREAVAAAPAAPPPPSPAAAQAAKSERAAKAEAAKHTGLFQGMVVIAGIVVLLAVGAAIFMPSMRQPGALGDLDSGKPPPPPPPMAVKRFDKPTHSDVDAAEKAAQAAAQAAAAQATAAAWTRIQTEVDAAAAANDWAKAERLLGDYLEGSAKDDAILAAQARERRNQLLLDGTRWKEATMAALPAGDAPTALAGRLRAVTTMRDQVLADDRAEIEALWQETLAKTGQLLNQARREARQALEAGRPERLAAIAAAPAPAFAGTPIAGVHRQFSMICAEAAAIKAAANWPATAERLRMAKGGPESLAAGAALIIAGDVKTARIVLGREPALNSGDLLRRREALFGRQAAILTFDDPADLQEIDVLQGEPRLDTGALTGAPGEAIGLVCGPGLAGGDWDAGLACEVAIQAKDGEAVISLQGEGAIPVQARIEAGQVVCRMLDNGTLKEQKLPWSTGPLRLRIAGRAGAVTLLINDKVVLQTAKGAVAKGAQLRFEAAGVAWKLTDVQILGGG